MRGPATQWPDQSRWHYRRSLASRVAVLTTLALARPASVMAWVLIIAGIGIGAVIGGITASITRSTSSGGVGKLPVSFGGEAPPPPPPTTAWVLATDSA